MASSHQDIPPTNSRDPLLARLLHSGLELICVCDVRGKLFDVNAAWHSQFGYRREDLIGHEMADFIHPDDQAAAREVAAEVAKPGIRVIEFENRFRRKDGEYRWLSWSGRSDGENWLAIARDVTARKRAEERAQLFVSLVELSDDFIALAGLDQRVLFVNAAGRRLVGLDSLEEARSHPLSDYLTEAGRHRSLTVEQPAVLREGRWSGESTLRHFRTGAEIAVSINSFLVTSPDTGQPIALATVQHDITEAKQAKAEVEQLGRERARLAVLALREADNERVRLAESLHDSVMQSLAIARQEVEELIAGDAAAGARAIAAIAEATGALRTTLRGIHPTAAAYDDLCTAIERLRGAVVDAGMEFRVSCADDIPSGLNGLIYGVVRELVRNAVEHAGGSRVVVSVDHDGEIVTAEVIDDGHGIAAGRLAAALREGHIGLAACRERALDADGKLLVQAVSPGGTRVVLVFPCPAA